MATIDAPDLTAVTAPGVSRDHILLLVQMKTFPKQAARGWTVGGTKDAADAIMTYLTTTGDATRGADLVGKRVAWEHGASTIVGTATRYDEDDDELYLMVDGLIHAHLWVPAAESRLAEDS